MKMKSADVKAAGADDKYVDVAWWRRGVVTGDTRETTLPTGSRGRRGRRGRREEGEVEKGCPVCMVS